MTLMPREGGEGRRGREGGREGGKVGEDFFHKSITGVQLCVRDVGGVDDLHAWGRGGRDGGREER